MRTSQLGPEENIFSNPYQSVKEDNRYSITLELAIRTPRNISSILILRTKR
jgi:hypothetical protein